MIVTLEQKVNINSYLQKTSHLLQKKVVDAH